MNRQNSTFCEAEIRRALSSWLLVEHAESDTVVIKELGVCRGQVPGIGRKPVCEGASCRKTLVGDCFRN